MLLKIKILLVSYWFLCLVFLVKDILASRMLLSMRFLMRIEEKSSFVLFLTFF